MNKDDFIKDLCKSFAEILENQKAEDIVIIDLANKTDIAQYMIIATGRSSRHVAATADHIKDKIKEYNLNYHIEGMPNSEWVLIDAMDIIVHLFSKEKRQAYALENIWKE